MAAGKFITLEGGEGVGKSTQARALASALRSRGHDVIETREPGGSPGAEAIRALLLEGEADRWTPGAEALLFAAARADHVAKTIRPALERGAWVVCDRFLDSSLAYQSIAGGIALDKLRMLHKVGSANLMPDRTLLLTLPPEEALLRAQTRDRGATDRIGGRHPTYHAKVASTFLLLADAEPTRFCVIDATGEANTVTARLLAAVEGL